MRLPQWAANTTTGLQKNGTQLQKNGTQLEGWEMRDKQKERARDKEKYEQDRKADK